MDWGAKVCGHEPFGSCDGDGLRPRVEQGARADGTVADGARGMHRDGRCLSPEEKAAKIGITGSRLFRRASCRAPTVWTKLEIVYQLRGELNEGAVKHAIELSEEKYCSVSAMLKKTAKVSWRYEILRGEA